MLVLDSSVIQYAETDLEFRVVVRWNPHSPGTLHHHYFPSN
jgi:hypothetical protein